MSRVEIMSDEEILNIVKGAFRPFCCFAELDDYGAKLRFRVYRENPKIDIHKEPGWPLEPLRDKRKLESSLLSARAEIQGKGFPLVPWRVL